MEMFTALKLWVTEILLIILKQNFMLPTLMDGVIRVINVLDNFYFL